MLSALFAGLAAGCSSEPTRYPVSGTVTMDGVPAGLAVVKFFPADPGTHATSGGSVIADIAGKFSIGARGTNSGLPAGEYKVTFSQTVDRGRPVMGSGGKKSEAVPGVEAVPEAYRNPKTTPISARVGRDSTTFTFDIKKKT
jgi:hypothetical protein